MAGSASLHRRGRRRLSFDQTSLTGGGAVPPAPTRIRPVMNELEERVVEELRRLDADFETMACDPELADTAAFCEHYGVDPADSANAILVASKKPAGRFALCLVLATDRLDVNQRVRNQLDVKKLSFAPGPVTREVTGMEIGGVTPFGLHGRVDIYVDESVMGRPRVVVGGGSRSMKIRLDPEVFARMDTVVVGPFALPTT